MKYNPSCTAELLNIYGAHDVCDIILNEAGYSVTHVGGTVCYPTHPVQVCMSYCEQSFMDPPSKLLKVKFSSFFLHLIKLVDILYHF